MVRGATRDPLKRSRVAYKTHLGLAVSSAYPRTAARFELIETSGAIRVREGGGADGPTTPLIPKLRKDAACE